MQTTVDAPLSTKSFGWSDRYYARAERSPSRIRFIDELVGPNMAELVQQTFQTWNSQVREQLRETTGCKLAADTPVPVKVVAGLPGPLLQIVEQNSQELLWWLLINRALLEQTESGLGLLIGRLDGIKKAVNWPVEAQPSEGSIHQTIDLIKASLSWLELGSIAQKVSSIEEDFLGAYFFHIPVIHIYWQAIGMASALFKIPPDTLTIVVLAHELAHAYTCGEDKDGAIWHKGNFAAADLHIVEGLAQFYTQMVCEKLETRKPGLITAFEELLRHLPPPYSCFREWAPDHDRSREVIRYGMIDCRARGTTSYERFLERLAEIKQSLPKRQKHYGPSPEPDQFSSGETLSPGAKAIQKQEEWDRQDAEGFSKAFDKKFTPKKSQPPKTNTPT